MLLSDPASRRQPLHLTRPSPPSGWPEDLHLQTAEHAQHTTKPLCGSRRGLRLSAFHPSVSLAAQPYHLRVFLRASVPPRQEASPHSMQSRPGRNSRRPVRFCAIRCTRPFTPSCSVTLASVRTPAPECCN